MPRYKALPDELDPCARQLVAGLRRLKDRSELTMRHLATKTGYSAKSWERYLGGTSLPPRDAVEALASITGTDPAPLVALHEIADATRNSRRARPVARRQEAQGHQERRRNEEREREGKKEQEQPSGPPGPHPGSPGTPVALTAPPAPGPAPDRVPRIALTAGVVALAVALLSALLLVLRLDENVPAVAAAAVVPSRTATASLPPSYTCRVTRVDGHWSAGVNSGRNTQISYGARGVDVAEAQCLLRRAGISPGGIDGIFGPLTLRAVRTFQQRAGLVVDGILGPRSWKTLRG